MKPLLVLRPEPGNSATAERARALGLHPVQRPLFTVEPVEWTAPDIDGFDYLLLTSANAVRFGGSQLARLGGLSTLAVGPATAAAAQAAGLRVERTGDGGVEDLLATLPDGKRLLHLTGAAHVSPASAHRVVPIIAYRAVRASPDVPDGDMIALVHSARAGMALAELVGDRSTITIAAISAAAGAASGAGWAGVHVAKRPDDAALLALAARLCQD